MENSLKFLLLDFQISPTTFNSRKNWIQSEECIEVTNWVSALLCQPPPPPRPHPHKNNLTTVKQNFIIVIIVKLTVQETPRQHLH